MCGGKNSPSHEVVFDDDEDDENVCREGQHYHRHVQKNYGVILDEEHLVDLLARERFALVERRRDCFVLHVKLNNLEKKH